ncbi:MAG TPA: exodeoxyribonuclease VII large subunit, partial [Chromatiaceae bacterium]|nr:exodeoxyribonuclease VII large subunit [Chromatiaceae bacterium]
ADARGECDLLILARGGGSLEDLAAFNDEQLAHTIAQLKTPLISAVGHETDFTIADFVADRRAPTPSAAAELATPDRSHLQQKVSALQERLALQLQRLLRERGSRLEHARHKLQLLHPGRRLEQQQQRLDELERRLRNTMQQCIEGIAGRLQQLRGRLAMRSPAQRLASLQQRLESNSQYLRQLMRHQLELKHNRIINLSRALQAVSPLQTLARGYSITSDAESGRVLTDASEVQSGQQIHTRLAHGQLLSVVEEVRKE